MATPFAVLAGTQATIEIREGHCFLIIVQDGKVTHHTPNVSPQEIVKKTFCCGL